MVKTISVDRAKTVVTSSLENIAQFCSALSLGSFAITFLPTFLLAQQMRSKQLIMSLLLRSSSKTGLTRQYQQPSIAFAARTNTSSSTAAVVVHQTSNVELDEHYPAILDYRKLWEELGFRVEVTPGSAIRGDVERMQSKALLDVFDHLPMNVLQYDFWRYIILYLEGGVYADVDCEPPAGCARGD